MIFSETRFPLFRMMLWENRKHSSWLSGLLAFAPALRFDAVGDLANGDTHPGSVKRPHQRGEPWMTRFRHLICTAIAAVGLMLSGSHRHDQQLVADQLGLITHD